MGIFIMYLNLSVIKYKNDNFTIIANIQNDAWWEGHKFDALWEEKG